MRRLAARIQSRLSRAFYRVACAWLDLSIALHASPARKPFVTEITDAPRTLDLAPCTRCGDRAFVGGFVTLPGPIEPGRGPQTKDLVCVACWNTVWDSVLAAAVGASHSAFEDLELTRVVAFVRRRSFEALRDGSADGERYLELLARALESKIHRGTELA